VLGEGRKHLLALVEPDHLRCSVGERQARGTRAAADVEDAPSLAECLEGDLPSRARPAPFFLGLPGPEPGWVQAPGRSLGCMEDVLGQRPGSKLASPGFGEAVWVQRRVCRLHLDNGSLPGPTRSGLCNHRQVREPPSPALLTDRYELTMVDALEQEGMLERPCVFEVFARRLPAGRRYGVVAGTGRLLELLQAFRFEPDTLAWLRSEGIVGERTAAWLSRRLPAPLDVDGLPEGSVYFPGSPLLRVSGPLGAAIVLETLVLSVLNFDSAVAAAASRMTLAVRGHRSPEAPALIEMGSRRTNELAGPAAGRAAVVAGFSSSSNLEASRRYGVPSAGTVAHAFVLAHADEREAFAAQVAAQGPGTTILVDTYDIQGAIRLALEVAGPELGAIRIDSGELDVEARRARALLDSLGAKGTRIVVSGDLDEHAIARLERATPERAPIDAYGVGTRLVAGSGAPSAELVYKLVALGTGPEGGMRPVAKRSAGKSWPGGPKQVWRELSDDGELRGEVVRPLDAPRPSDRKGSTWLPALVPLLSEGRPVAETQTPRELGRFHRRVLCSLPEAGCELDDGPPALVPVLEVP